MASTQISPGVVVLERDLTNTVNATVDNIAAVVGTFEKGPVDEVRVISSERQLVEEFGKPNDSNYEYWFSAAQFMLYGGSVKVVRATSTSLKNSIDTTTVTDTTFSATDTTLTVAEATEVTGVSATPRGSFKDRLRNRLNHRNLWIGHCCVSWTT